MKTHEFEKWLNTARIGDQCTYHTGANLLVSVQMKNPETGEMESVMAKSGASIIAWEAYEKGLVHLAQRRVGPNKFDWIAERHP